MTVPSEDSWSAAALAELGGPIEQTNSCECPHCHETFYALPLHDPLKHHIDYCESRPESDDENGN